MIESILSWLINAGFIAILVASADAKRGYHIEDHQLLSFFLVFILPTIAEIVAQYAAHKPFVWWILGI